MSGLHDTTISDDHNFAPSNGDALAADNTISDAGSRGTQYDLPKAKLKRAIEHIREHLGENLRTLDVAVYLGISQYHFSRLFKQSMGMTVHAYLIEQRIHKAMQLLRETELSILVISEQCGFANPSHLARCFRKRIGISPRQYRVRE